VSWRWFASLALVLACAPSLPPRFEQERAAAERAYAAGRYDEAALHWQRAEQAAERKRDKNEARYRAARSLERAGRHKEAQRMLSNVGEKSSRAARAAYDHAVIEIERGDAAKGWAELERVMRRFPASGIAPSALGRLLRRQEDQGGTARALRYLEKTRVEFRETELSERVEYAYADLLERANRTSAARDQYLLVAKRFPYPHGALWDDALWKASLLEEKLGNVPAAIQHLERMLKEMEPSSLQGSYQRPRYAAARFRIAELFRDRVRDLPRAVKEFQKVWDDHPTSILRDDALWQKARIERSLGLRSRSCSSVRRLVEDVPDSRYSACAKALCPSASVPPKSKCHAYVVRDLGLGE
jgi:tetratricopeptide (TPR) repeat protein